MLTLDRIYSQPQQVGFRVLVDRLWPRGVKKEAAHLDLWAKTIAPSPDLRKWFNHDPEKFAEFSQRYRQELEQNPDVPDFITTLKAQTQPVILLYAAKDETYNHAQVLKQWLTEAMHEQN